MRAVRWMAWVLVVLVCVVNCVTGCMASHTSLDKDTGGLDETDPGDLQDAPQAECTGTCEPEPPLPFNPRIHGYGP